MNINNKQLEFIDIVSLGSAGLGVYNTILNQKQISNDELFDKLIKELKKDIKEDNNRVMNIINSKLDKILIKEGGDNMNEYREVMEHICEKGEKYEEMVEYKIVMEGLMHKLDKYYPELFHETMEKLEEVVYAIPLEKAKEIVKHMKPFGEHWRFEDVKLYIEGKGIYNKCEKYYLVMNAMYNDYYDVATNFGHQNDTDFYYELTNAFINDVDGKEFKVEKYFMD